MARISLSVDVLLQLTGTGVTRKYQGHAVGIYKLQESCALHVSSGKGTYIISYGNDGVHRTVTLLLSYYSLHSAS